jgi:hypothetical protein
MSLGAAIASGAGGKQNHVRDGVLAEAEPIRYRVNLDTVDDLLNRQFGLRHRRFRGGL